MTTTQDTHNTMTQQKHMTTHDTTHGAYAHTCNEGVFFSYHRCSHTTRQVPAESAPADSADDRRGLICGPHPAG